MVISSWDREDEIQKVGIFLNVREHHAPIRRLINTLNEFRERKDTYPDPDAYLEMLFPSIFIQAISKSTGHVLSFKIK